MSMPMEPWELLARECIRDLVTRYNSNGDSGRIAQVLELFTHDATMELASEGGETSTYRGIDEIEAMFTGAIETYREAADERAQPGYVRHCVTTHQIDIGDRRHATGRCYFFVIRANGLDHWGRYVDGYEERDGRWRFTYRKVTTEGHQTGPA